MTQLEMDQRETVSILGVPVDRLTMAAALDRVEAFIASGDSHFIATADASMLVDAAEDPSFKAMLLDADMVTPDSSGVLWAANRLGTPLPEKVSGVDLVDRICGLSADRGYRVFFLGAAPGVAEMAAERLRLKHPGCNIVGTRHGYFPAADDELVAAEVAATGPDVLFVAMGIPRQEKFIVKTQPIIKAKVAMGVGGSMDVYSGKAKRAPIVIQRLKLEWLWRLILNPSKWRKARKLPLFRRLVVRAAK